MKVNLRGLVLALLAVVMVTSVTTLAQESVRLVPYTSEAYEFESVIPEGWTDVGRGIFARQSSSTDRAVIAQQSAPLSADALLTALLPQLNLTTAPESVGTYKGGALEWTLYRVDISVGTINVVVDLALSEVEAKTYLVLVRAAPEEYEALHQSIFLPVLDAFAPLKVMEETVPYVVEEVTFKNGDVTLAGTLTLPPTEGAHPVIVLVSGSGPQDRDETLGGGIAIKPFRLLADALTRAGVAVLRYDDRGVGKSTGNFETATTKDFASDAEAAISYLLTRKEINPDQIGLLGHSEGGLVAAMLGASNKDLDSIIALAGPGVNGTEVLLQQNRRLLEAEGASPEEIEAQVAYVEELLTLLDDPTAMEEVAYKHILKQAQAMPEEQRAALGDLEEYARRVAQQTAQRYSSAWFKFFLDYDPATDWAKTTIPVLALFGGKDVQVDAEQNAPALEAALKQAGNDDYEIVTLPNANHLFQEANTGGLSEYGTLPAKFTPDLLPTILGWLQQRVTITQ